jgi:hypothetical protein
MRALRPAVVLGLALLPARAAVGDVPDEPEAVLSRVLELNAKKILWVDESATLLTGEAARRWRRASIGEFPDRPDVVVRHGEDRAVGRVLQEKDGRKVDVYFFLERGPNWRVSGMRKMADLDALAGTLADLEASPDTSASDAFTLENLRLSVRDDAALKAWFLENRHALDGVADAARRTVRPGASAGFDDRSTSVSTKLRKLALTSVAVQEGGTVEVVVGGLGTSTVGFLLSPKDTPPEPDGTSVLWVERLAPRWYLIRRI